MYTQPCLNDPLHPLQAKSRASELSSKLQAGVAAEAGTQRQLAAAQQEVARLNSQLSDRGRQATQAELQRDALQREIVDVSS